MDSTLRGNGSAPVVDSTRPTLDALLFDGDPRDVPEADGPLQSAFRHELDTPGLVLSPGYIGPDRRATGPRARLARATFGSRRSVLRFEILVVGVVVVLVTASLLMVSAGGRTLALTPAAARSKAGLSVHQARVAPTFPAAEVPARVTRRVPVKAKAVAPAPTTTTTPPTVPTPVATPAPTPTTTPTTTPPPPVAAAPAATPAAALTPDQLGAEALTLVRYPWQNIPGYSIQFFPIADAPSPGFYGNTTFTWGSPGGTSDLYVYPGETVDQLAGIIAFEIGHEVDAAAVEPQGGQTQIEDILGIHPASWAPNCDCAEQGFLSGWYAAAFSDYWSPGVGEWSTIAPEPSGAVLAAVEPWLTKTVS
jgi:hypothetical protein